MIAIKKKLRISQTLLFIFSSHRALHTQ